MNSFDQFIESSARSYLQSVVYIDDRIYLPSSKDKNSVDGLPPSRDLITQLDPQPPCLARTMVHSY